MANEGKVNGFSWFGCLLAPFYDNIMKNNVFPRKFGSSYERHIDILKKELSDVHGLKVLDIASGTGMISDCLGADNEITCTDISPYLLRLAGKKFGKQKMQGYNLIVADAKDLPFEDNRFDVATCILALNFFSEPGKVIAEIQRTLKRTGKFVCSVPEASRLKAGSHITGTLFKEEDLRKLFVGSGMTFSPLPEENGSLLYFISRMS
ncbi:MAG: methyltransferase domain-containing protein [Sphaerochaetaceae bacterium]